MKKTYIEPETTLEVLVGGEPMMQYVSVLNVYNDPDETEEVDDFDDLLSNYNNRLWEE